MKSNEPIWHAKMKHVASFGGARFYVTSVEYESGRKVKKHAFDKGGSVRGPSDVGRIIEQAIKGGSSENLSSSEAPYVEDLGASIKQFVVKGYWLESSSVFGLPDYMKARDLFLQKMGEDKARTLVLPTFGALKVRPGKVTTRFLNSEGGIETFVASFHKESINTQPTFTSDTLSTMLLSIQVLYYKLERTMPSTFGVRDVTDSVRALGTGTGTAVIPEDAGVAPYVAEETLTALEKFRNAIERFTGYGATKLAELNKLQQQLNGFSNYVTELILAPTELATSMTAIVRQLSNIFIRPIDAFNSQRDLFSNFSDDIGDIIGDTLDAFGLKSNRDSIISIVENSAASEMMRTAGNIDFDSLGQALTIRDDIIDLVDGLQLKNADVFSEASPYLEMRSALADFVRDITVRSALLPIVENIKLQEGLPLLVIAHGLYNDATRFEEIQSRNKVINTLLPQNDLEVLSI